MENLDSDVDGWEMISSIFSFVHEVSLRILRENVRNGQVGTLERGFSVGDWRFGYTSVPSPGGETIRRAGREIPRRIYEILEDQAIWVRQVFHWFAIEFREIQWIVRELNRHKVPKDHRATTEKWSHQLVISLLRSPKYIGIWTWGELENVRNPASGKVSQVPRDEEEYQDWMRQREDLRIVADELFIEAQERLDENARRMEAYRDEKGRLRGSDGSHRVQLLTGLMICPECGHKFYVTGPHGDYLQCSGARDGVCSFKTMLPRRLAEQRILEVIGQRMLHDPQWLDAVYLYAVQSWHERRRQQPDSTEELQRRKQQLDSRIHRLLDELEADEPDPDIRQRLEERQRERHEVVRQLERLQSQERLMPSPPTREWVAEQLQCLHEALQSNVAAANAALSQLLGGSIRLELISEEGRKRKFWRGRFRIHTLAFSNLPVVFPTDGDEGVANADAELVLDFRELPLEETQIQDAWRLLQEGFSFTEIAGELGVGKARMTAIMKSVARRFGNGLTPKELKQEFQKPNDKSHLYGPFLEPAMELYHQGMLICEIAKQLKTNRKRIELAIAAWHRDRNLPVPDGRTRRQSLDYKGRSGWTNRPRYSGPDAPQAG